MLWGATRAKALIITATSSRSVLPLFWAGLRQQHADELMYATKYITMWQVIHRH
jgi:hypothetical protein